MVSLLRGMKIVLLDLDGTIHLGGIPIPGAVDFIQRCHESEVKTIFLSNNSSKSVNEYVIKKFADNELILVCYFSIIFLIGFYLLNNNFKNKYLKNLKMKEH